MSIKDAFLLISYLCGPVGCQMAGTPVNYQL